MKRLMLGLCAVLFLLTGCYAVNVHTETPQSITSRAELDELLDAIDDETAVKIIKMMVDAPVDIELSKLSIENADMASSFHNDEFPPFLNEQSVKNCGFRLLENGLYDYYKCDFIEEEPGGRLKRHFVTVLVEVGEDDKWHQPLHVYAYHRVIEKRVGGIEPVTEPDWTIWTVQVGGPKDKEPKIYR